VDKRGSISVSGSAQANCPLDAALVVLGVETTDKTLEPAVKANSERAKAVLEALKIKKGEIPQDFPLFSGTRL
jgi:uncharacterized protein YggE